MMLKMMLNEKTVTVKIKRRQLCDLILACSILDTASDEDTQKWHELHAQLTAILADFDEKQATD